MSHHHNTWCSVAGVKSVLKPMVRQNESEFDGLLRESEAARAGRRGRGGDHDDPQCIVGREKSPP